VLVMFPEGTRQKSGRVGEGMAGVGLLAVGAGVPVVPAYIHGTSGFWKNWVRRGRLSVRFGAALRCEALPEGAPRADAARALARSVMEAIRALEASALGERGASVSRVDGTGAGPSPEA
jgi:1-acyl-sn-glycerol-3-phosphate acyltransferase